MRYRDAMRMYGDLGLAFERARAAVEAVRLVGESDLEISAAAEDAQHLFDRLRATTYLTKLDEARRAAQARVTSPPAPAATRVTAHP